VTVFERGEIPSAVPPVPSAVGEEAGGEAAAGVGGVEEVLDFVKARKKEVAERRGRSRSPERKPRAGSPQRAGSSPQRRGDPMDVVESPAKGASPAQKMSPAQRAASPVAASPPGAAEATPVSPPAAAAAAPRGKENADAPRAALAVSPTPKPSREIVDSNKRTERARLAELASAPVLPPASGEEPAPHALAAPALNSSLFYQRDVAAAASSRFDATQSPAPPPESLRFASDVAANVPGDRRVYEGLVSVDVRAPEVMARAGKASAAAYVEAVRGAEMGKAGGVDERKVGVGVGAGGRVGGAGGGRAGEHRRRGRGVF
jgi:hypothetical protein